MSFHNNLHLQLQPLRYLEEEAEADPLVISDVSSLLRVDCLVNTRVSHVNTNPLPECAGDGVGGVDPAVSVQDVLGNVFGVNTVYGVAHVLPGGDDEGEGEQEGHGGPVVEPKYTGVDSDVVRLHQTFQSAEYFQHGPSPTLSLTLTI